MRSSWSWESSSTMVSSGQISSRTNWRIQSSFSWNSGSVEKSHAIAPPLSLGVRAAHYAGRPLAMRVVVTGATGNVGTALLRALRDEDAVTEIVGIARREPSVAPPPKTTWVRADVSRGDLEPLLEGADCGVHLAWPIQASRDETVTEGANVKGSARVFESAARAGVPAVVYASSIGTYAPGPKDRGVDESWPATGIETSFYSRHKAAVERELDSFTAAHPDIRVAWLRPGLIFQRAAATGIRRLFVGPLLPSPLVRRELVPVVPRHPRLRAQALHSDDVADAYRRAIVNPDARGAYNVAGPTPPAGAPPHARAPAAPAPRAPAPPPPARRPCGRRPGAGAARRRGPELVAAPAAE